jgi:hypothetical protein
MLGGGRRAAAAANDNCEMDTIRSIEETEQIYMKGEGNKTMSMRPCIATPLGDKRREL